MTVTYIGAAVLGAIVAMVLVFGQLQKQLHLSRADAWRQGTPGQRRGLLIVACLAGAFLGVLLVWASKHYTGSN